MNDKHFGTWEEAVRWLMEQPDQKGFVEACYYDQPLICTAQRFRNSAEWQATRALLPKVSGRVLDIGAGNGIASYALCQDGWDVVALDPDASSLVGTRAILSLKRDAELQMSICQGQGEELPYSNHTFDAVYGRQVLHHANHLSRFISEIYRVLKPGGLLIATREHVISSKNHLDAFLEHHPLHKYYGGENAFLLREYRTAFQEAGFKILYILGPFETVINFAPFTEETLKAELNSRLNKLPGGSGIAKVILSRKIIPFSLNVLSSIDQRPGRLYSFVVEK